MSYNEVMKSLSFPFFSCSVFDDDEKFTCEFPCKAGGKGRGTGNIHFPRPKKAFIKIINKLIRAKHQAEVERGKV